MSGKSETVRHCGAWLEQEARGESHVYRGPVDCGCGWGDLCDAPREQAPHWHVATGLAGYGPDGSDGYACFDSLSGALEYARDEVLASVDYAHDSAHAAAASDDYRGAWEDVLRMESLETLAANLGSWRKSAPLYLHDPDAYAALQESQAADFPHDVSHNTRLYLWQCEDPTTCEHCDEDGGC